MSDGSAPVAVPPHESVFAPGNDAVDVLVLTDDDGDCSGEVSTTPIDGARAHALRRDRKPSISVTEYADGQHVPDAAATLRAAAAAAAVGVMGVWADGTGDLDRATAAAAAAAAAHALPTG